MDNGVIKYFQVQKSVIEDFDEVKSNLKNYFTSIGEKFNWKIVNSTKTTIKYETKYDWVFGLQQNILIDYSNRNIKIQSFDPIGTTPWTGKLEERNNKNCDKVMIEIDEILINYNNSEFEIKRKKLKDERNQELVNKKNLQLNEFKLNKSNIINELDKDSNGEIDLVDGESFNKLLTKNQKCIVEIDKNYIQKFVKISMYLKTKKSNTQKIFDSIKDTKNDTELNELLNLLKNQIHTYELLLFHSISMITSLVESDLITFYEIHECFDQLGVFNSNWENEVTNKLSDIGDGIKDLMYSIYQMENKIVSSIDNLTYVTQDSFEELNNSVNKHLSSIESSIKFNNLLTGIQTYQMYKINQNTKRIN